MEEEVLVFPEALLERLGSFEGFSARVSDYLPTLLDPTNLRYLPRSEAEEDPSFKQLIPYVVLRHEETLFTYSRGKKGGESRLHDRLSIGVGGHICREDGAGGSTAYEAGFARELAEEVVIESAYEERIVGLVYDPSTPVGAVHVGVVHLFELAKPQVRAIDPALSQGGFWRVEDLLAQRERLETWSSLTLDHLLLAKATF